MNWGDDPLSNEQVRVGVAGLGRSGWNIHVEGLRKRSDYKVVAVADPEAERRAEAEEQLGAKAYQAPEEMIADPSLELVVIATPSHTHADLACRALEAGKHVLVEKPMAVNVAEVDRMMAAAKAHGRVLTVYQIRRLDPDYVKAKAIIESGLLGPIVLVRMARCSYQRRNDWQTLRKFGGGMLNNWGAHIVDQGLQLLEGDPVELFADMQNTVAAGDAEDHLKIVLKGAGGMVVDVEISSCAAFPQPEWLVIGKYGSLTGSTRQLRWKYYDPTQAPKLEVDEGPAAGRRYGRPEELPWIEEEAEIERSDTRAEFYDALYRTLRQGEPPLVTPESVRRQIALFDECRRRTGF